MLPQNDSPRKATNDEALSASSSSSSQQRTDAGARPSDKPGVATQGSAAAAPPSTSATASGSSHPVRTGKSSSTPEFDLKAKLFAAFLKRDVNSRKAPLRRVNPSTAAVGRQKKTTAAERKQSLPAIKPPPTKVRDKGKSITKGKERIGPRATPNNSINNKTNITKDIASSTGSNNTLDATALTTSTGNPRPHDGQLTSHSLSVPILGVSDSSSAAALPNSERLVTSVPVPMQASCTPAGVLTPVSALVSISALPVSSCAVTETHPFTLTPIPVPHIQASVAGKSKSCSEASISAEVTRYPAPLTGSFSAAFMAHTPKGSPHPEPNPKLNSNPKSTKTLVEKEAGASPGMCRASAPSGDDEKVTESGGKKSSALSPVSPTDSEISNSTGGKSKPVLAKHINTPDGDDNCPIRHGFKYCSECFIRQCDSGPFVRTSFDYDSLYETPLHTDLFEHQAEGLNTARQASLFSPSTPMTMSDSEYGDSSLSSGSTNNSVSSSNVSRLQTYFFPYVSSTSLKTWQCRECAALETVTTGPQVMVNINAPVTCSKCLSNLKMELKITNGEKDEDEGSMVDPLLADVWDFVDLGEDFDFALAFDESKDQRPRHAHELFPYWETYHGKLGVRAEDVSTVDREMMALRARELDPEFVAPCAAAHAFGSSSHYQAFMW